MLRTDSIMEVPLATGGADEGGGMFKCIYNKTKYIYKSYKLL